MRREPFQPSLGPLLRLSLPEPKITVATFLITLTAENNGPGATFRLLVIDSKRLAANFTTKFTFPAKFALTAQTMMGARSRDSSRP